MEERTENQERGEGAWWYRPEIAILTLLVVGIYAVRLTALPVCGEESRRATVAMEMMDTGDWIVPRQQGQWYFSRPPLQNWIIAGFGLARGEVDVAAIRLPSALAILVTALLIYGYGRTFLSRFGAFAAGAVFITAGQVLQIGNLGETEAIFTLLVSASLLVWHWGYVRSWPPAWFWIAGGTLAALGALAKGLQAPAYFFGTVGVFLVVRRDWRRPIAWQPLAGVAVLIRPDETPRVGP
jgi:4-amino-4-deoxy-L-arabinose transferase-like glycosyltransferase